MVARRVVRHGVQHDPTRPVARSHGSQTVGVVSMTKLNHRTLLRYSAKTKLTIYFVGARYTSDRVTTRIKISRFDVGAGRARSYGGQKMYKKNVDM